MTARPSPSLPQTTRHQHKPGPRGSCGHWRRTPEPLSAPALASLLAEPGRRRRLLSSYDRALRRHEQAGHVERAGHERNGRGRPAIIWRITPAGRRWLDDHDNAPARAAAAAAQARRAAAERDQALDEARATFTPRLPGSAANAPLTNSENSAPPSTRSARSSTSAKKESARTSSGTRRHANPPENPSHAPASAKPNSSWPVNIGVPLKAPPITRLRVGWSHTAGPAVGRSGIQTGAPERPRSGAPLLLAEPAGSR